MSNDCKECLNSRLVVSENGYKAICTLSSKASNNCLCHGKCRFKNKKNKEAVQSYLMGLAEKR